jgi:hypothetical protein
MLLAACEESRTGRRWPNLVKRSVRNVGPFALWKDQDMPKKRRVQKSASNLAELLRLGGTQIPAGFATKAATATKALLRRQAEESSAVRKQVAALYGKLRGSPAVTIDDPDNKKALDGLLSYHKKLASKKLAFPKAATQVGGFYPGVISGKVVPPFDFADTIPTLLANVSDPTLSVSANVNGQLSASAVSSQVRGFNGGSEYARVGFFFHPMTAGTLTISASPTYSYQWSTNSLNTNLVTSFGSVSLAIYGMDTMNHIPVSAGANYDWWDEQTTGEIHLDFDFDVTKSATTSLGVTHSLVYLCFVAIDAHVVGMGWPGSLATSMISATVPSISYEFVPYPVFAQS